jgi:hypothetical protein
MNAHVVAEIVLRHFGNLEMAIRYCERVASFPGPLSGEYADAARILRASLQDAGTDGR